MAKRKKFLCAILCMTMIVSQFTVISYAGDELNSVSQTTGNAVSESQAAAKETSESTTTGGAAPGDTEAGGTTDSTATNDTKPGGTTDSTASSDTKSGGTTDSTTTGDTKSGGTTDSTVTDSVKTGETTGSAVTDTDSKTEVTTDSAVTNATTAAAIEPLKMTLMESAGTFSISDYDVNMLYEKGSTFTISTTEELNRFSDLVNGKFKNTTGEAVSVDFDGDTVRLEMDMTISLGWKPAGTEKTPFSGTFDGKNHTLDGLNIVTSDSYQALFGYTLNGEVKDLTVSGSIKSSGDYIGGIVGYANCTDITRCTSNVVISDGGSYVGGIAGCATGYTTLCVNNKDVSGNKNFIGGIAGLNYGLAQDCLNKGNISGTNYIGGINGKGKVKNSLSLGSFTGTGDHVSGVSPEGTVNNCYSKEQCTEVQLKYGYITYQLNTSGGTVESSNRWKQGADYPEFGSEALYKFSLYNNSADNITITYFKNGNKISESGVFKNNGIETVYAPACELSVQIMEKEHKEGFHFRPDNVLAKIGETYKVTLDKNIYIEAGYGELPSELAENEIKWYVENKDAATYTLENAKQLTGLAKLVNGVAKDSKGEVIPPVSFDGKTITLSNDIDLQNIDWTPMGYDTWNHCFSGTFNGQNHTIKGLHISNAVIKVSDKELTDKGLFGDTDSAVIKNLIVEGTMDSSGNNLNSKVGGIIGNASGSTIENCVNKVRITGGGCIGGIAGSTSSNSIIKKCSNEGVLTGSNSVGGVVGSVSSTKIDACVNKAQITGSDAIGGIAGNANWSTEITNCKNQDAVKGDTRIGGIAGYVNQTTITSCENSGEITGNNGTGGIFGDGQNSQITKCVNKAMITGKSTIDKDGKPTDSQYTGGIAGKAESSANIKYCENDATIKGGLRTGGIAGSNNATVQGCYNTGEIDSSTELYVGGIVGYGSATDCYSNGDVIVSSIKQETKNVGDISGSSDKDSPKIVNCYSLGKVTGMNGKSGTVLTDAQLKSEYCAYVVYQLNTSGENSNNSGVWKQGVNGPEFGENNIYRLKIVNYSSKTVGLSYSKDNVIIPKEQVFTTNNNISSIYVTKGQIKITATPFADFEFKPTLSGENGNYIVNMESDLTYQCGIKAELEKATGIEASIKWYTTNPNARKYSINTATDLWGLMALVNGKIEGYVPLDFSQKTINLKNNIDLTTLSQYKELQSYEPIGSLDKPFKGNFYGNNYTISGLSINSALDNQGLFGYTSEGTIKDLKVQGNVKGKNNVGGIVGDAQSTKIINCILTGNSKIDGQQNVGGIVGNSLSSISKCICDTNTKVNSENGYVGGIAGTNTASVSDSYSLATILGKDDHKGGVVGSADTIKSCFYYNKDQKISVAGTASQVKNSYYLADAEIQGATGTFMKANQFAEKEIAYLLDTVEGAHNKIWQPGVCYPEFGKNTVYRISVAPKEVQEGKSIKIADPDQEKPYKVYTGEKGESYTYLLSNESVKLSVSSNDAVFAPLFYPQNTVKSEGDIYSVSNPQSDLNILYRFAPSVGPDIAWYTQDAEAKEYIIGTEGQLRGLALLVNGLAKDKENKSIAPKDFSGKTIKLHSDIDIIGQDWVEIGTKQTPFNGIFDGGGYCVSNYKIDSLDDNKGLFGYAGTAIIENLKVNGKVSGGANVGGIVGYLGEKSTILNCMNAGIIIGRGNYIGGIVGNIAQNGNIKNCSNIGDISGGNGDKAYVGGIVGLFNNYVNAEGCSNSGNITGNGIYIGGLFGNPCSYVTIRNCTNTGKVYGNNQYLGGIAGGIDSNLVEMKNCSNTGDITQTGNGAYKVGGITGDLGSPADAKTTTVTYCYNEGKIINNSLDTSNGGTGGVFGSIGANYGGNIHHCWNKGTIFSTASNTGGIVGYIDANSSVVDCYNLSDIIGTINTGGIAGSKADTATSNVESCFNYGGNVRGAGTNIGFIVGGNNSNILGCYYLDETTIKNEKGLIVPPSDLKAKKINADNFKKYDTIYTLNTREDTVKNRGVWLGGKTYPVFANGTEILLHKVDISSINQTNGKVAFSDCTDSIKYLEAEKKVSITITPKSGYVMGKYTVKSILGENIETKLSEDENHICIVEFTMPDIGVAINADFIDSTQKAGQKFNITFDANGGTWNSTEKTKVINGVDAYKRITKPENPIWGAREFKGWYLEKEGKTLYNFSSAVQSDLTLYAKWDLYYKVTLDPNGGNWQDQTKSFIKVAPNTDAMVPVVNPVRNGYEFAGWYTDKDDCFIPYNFSNKVADDITIYAGWVSEGYVQVIFDANGGEISKDGKSIEKFRIVVKNPSYIQSVFEQGFKITKKSGGKDMTFRGWYNDPKAGSKWDFGKAVTANMTLYAHWDGDKPVIIGGTEENPMEIEDLDQLLVLRDFVNNGQKDELKKYVDGFYFKLVKDITLPKDWEPIGKNSTMDKTDNPFAAHFDGSGHTITIAPGGRALFGNIQSAEIKNVDIFGKQIDSCGLIESYINEVTIDNCTIKSGTKLKGSGFVGDLIGQDGKVILQRCVVEKGVTVGYTKDQDGIGGLAGSVSCEVKDCISEADVFGRNYVGGIVGVKGQSMKPCTVSECYSGGSVNATGDYVGGIVGGGYNIAYPPGVQIYNCYSTAKIKGGNCVGGIFGKEFVKEPQPFPYIVENCYWHGDSIQADGDYVGGIVGYYEKVNKHCTLKNNFYAAPYEGLKGYGKINSISDSSFNPEEAFKLNPAEAFENGEVAYLLDGGQGIHSNIWTTGDKYPVFGKPSIYMSDGKVKGSGTITLSDGKHEDKAVYNPVGTTINVNAVPAKVESSKEPGKATENTLESIIVTYATGGTEDITTSKTFKSTGNDVVTATFKTDEKPIEPEPKPEPKPSDNNPGKHHSGGGSGNGNGNGTGNGNGDGNGTGTGTGDGTGSGNGIGKGSGTEGTVDGLGDGKGTAAGTTSGGRSNEGRKEAANAEDAYASISQEDVPRSQVVVNNDAKKTSEDSLENENSGGLEKGGHEGGGNGDTKKITPIKAFEIIKKVAKENPVAMAIVWIAIGAIFAMGAMRRFYHIKKQ
ncbi:MAG: InlB B-repeat-containing protein [Aminipila sp.]